MPRWGVLRIALPRTLSITKTVGMVNALAKLHNFCIGEADNHVPQTLDRDHFQMMNNPTGYVGEFFGETLVTPDLAHGDGTC